MTFKFIELFAGIGGFRSALDQLGGECVFASEIDKFATQSYRALYNGAPELHGDITQIDGKDIPDHDVLVGGFPCQAFSVAGQRKGFEDTRGTLFFEIARIAKEKRPRLMLLENVKGLLSHDQGRTFETMCAALNDIGYALDFRVLNSKYFGVPQNRERIFIVCDRDAAHESWTIEGNNVISKAKRRAQELGVRTFNFDWPENNEVTTRLRDILETNVDEKYYISEEKTVKLIEQLTKDPAVDKIPIDGDRRIAGWRVREDRVFAYQSDKKRSTAQEHIYLRENSIADSITVGHMPKHLETINDNPVMLGHVDLNGHDAIKRVYSTEGVAPTLTTMGGGHREPKIAEPYTVFQKTSSWTTTVKHDETGTLQAARLDKVPQVVTNEVRPVLTPDREEKRQQGRRFKDNDEESSTLTAQDKHGIAIGAYSRYRIRKLTPLECWRLQGFTDEQHAIAVSAGISDSQRYKQAGNAVTVNVICAIGERLVARLPQSFDYFEEAA